jgi:hypothetical protein
MRRNPLLTLLVVIPVGLRSQAPLANLAATRLRLGTDTFDVSVTGLSRVPERTSDVYVTTLSRGSGSDSNALIYVTMQETHGENGDLDSRSVDTVVVGYADLRLRRVRNVELNRGGARLVRYSGTVIGSVLAWRKESESGDTASRRSLDQPGGAPHATPALLARAAPLTPSWTLHVPLYDVRNDSFVVWSVDSVRSSVRGDRDVWRVYASGPGALGFVYTIDSTTRDMISLVITIGRGAIELAYQNRRYSALEASTSPTASLQRSDVIGRYALEGEMEVGSELLLRPNGTFAFMLAYGALDESGAGKWHLEGSNVVLQSEGVAHEPSVRLDRSSGVARDSLHVEVVDTAGRTLGGASLDFVYASGARTKSRTTSAGYTLQFDRGVPPAELGVGIDMLNFRVSFPLSNPAKSVYRFVFDRGDLGTRRFENEHVGVAPDTLRVTINGRRLTYVRH